MNRRDFLKTTLAGMAVVPLAGAAESSPAGRVMTVSGPIDTSALGPTLTHEHALVDFAGAEQTDPGGYDLDEAFATVLPHLQRIRDLGCGTFVDCTPAYIGRSPGLLARLSKASGVRILSNTGYYGAAGDKFLPAHAFTESADALAERWVAEWKNGIGHSGVRPGFIKIGVDSGPLSEVDRKLVRAASRTHLRTGLIIMSHTGPAVPAFEQLAVLAEEGVATGAWIWTHAQNEKDENALLRAADRGAWVGLDGVRADKTGFYVSRLQAFRARGLLGRVLLSHDAGWYSPGEPGGGGFRPYDALFTHLLPALREGGFSDDELRGLMETNPGSAFAVGVEKG